MLPEELHRRPFPAHGRGLGRRGKDAAAPAAEQARGVRPRAPGQWRRAALPVVVAGAVGWLHCWLRRCGRAVAVLLPCLWPLPVVALCATDFGVALDPARPFVLDPCRHACSGACGAPVVRYAPVCLFFRCADCVRACDRHPARSAAVSPGLLDRLRQVRDRRRRDRPAHGGQAARRQDRVPHPVRGGVRLGRRPHTPRTGPRYEPPYDLPYGPPLRRTLRPPLRPTPRPALAAHPTTCSL